MRAEGRYQIEMNFAKDAVLMKSYLERDRERGSDGRGEFQPRPRILLQCTSLSKRARVQQAPDGPSREAAMMHAARKINSSS